MNALNIANEVILEMDALIDDATMLATGYRSMKEMILNCASTRRLFVTFFIAKCGDADRALEVMKTWEA